MPIEIDATFWATVSLVLFVGLLFYLKVPSMIVKSLDSRSDEIREKLDEARNMREEAQQLLAEYQRKRKEAEAEAKTIIDAAEQEAKLMLEEAQRDQEEYVKRRTAMVEQRISHSESSAQAEIKSLAVDLAIEATKRILSEKIDVPISSKLFEDSLSELRSRLD